jgi:beta-galactosidase
MPPQASLIRPPPQDFELEAEPLQLTQTSRFLKAFSYSGPTTSVRVAKGAQNGAKIYVDRDYVFSGIPDPLKGCDWVQTAYADKSYSSVDLMELAAINDGVVYVAHDDRIERPDWLRRQFKPTDLRLAIHGGNMTLFERGIKKGESLTLGSNEEFRHSDSCNMYVVFVKGSQSRLSRG